MPSGLSLTGQRTTRRILFQSAHFLTHGIWRKPTAWILSNFGSVWCRLCFCGNQDVFPEVLYLYLHWSLFCGWLYGNWSYRYAPSRHTLNNYCWIYWEPSQANPEFVEVPLTRALRRASRQGNQVHIASGRFANDCVRSGSWIAGIHL